MTEEYAEPDWQRLGARFGVTDVCVRFEQPAEVFVHDATGAPARCVAEHVVALREDAWGVRVQVACGLFLELPGMSLAHVDAEEGLALVDRRVRVRPLAKARPRIRDDWFLP